jgi:hypothetical protein
LGRQDSNLRVAVSKTAALPLGYAPSTKKIIIIFLMTILKPSFLKLSHFQVKIMFDNLREKTII